MQTHIKDLSYVYHGTNGSAVILIHGMTGSPIEMKFVAKRLHRQGFTVYVPTLAGHGRDEATFVGSTWQDWYQTVEETLTEALKSHDKVYAAGLCVGGTLGLFLAHKNPKAVQAVTLYSATIHYDGWNTPFYFKYAHLLVPVGIRIPFLRNIRISDSYPHGIKSERIRRILVKRNKDAGDNLEGALPNIPVRGLHENYKLNHVLKKILPSITTPTLLLHAREDDVSSPQNSYYIKNHLGGIGEVQLLEDSYHLICVDQERDKVSDLTAQFFLRHS